MDDDSTRNRSSRIERYAAEMTVGADSQSRRRDEMLVGLSGVLSHADFLEALEALADRVRNVQQFEGHPRHGEDTPSDLTRAEDVLRSLHAALLGGSADLLSDLHKPAVAALRNEPELKAVAIKTGAAVRKTRDFGRHLRQLLESLDGSTEGDVATRIADSAIWRDCPLSYGLAGLTSQHAFLMPHVESWVLTVWRERRQGMDAGVPDFPDLCRSLLRELGVDEQDARNALRS
jgi:hypothetical protein